MNLPMSQFSLKADLPVGFPYRFNSSISFLIDICIFTFVCTLSSFTLCFHVTLSTLIRIVHTVYGFELPSFSSIETISFNVTSIHLSRSLFL